MHIEPRNGASIDRIYLHTNEGPQDSSGAVNLASYLDTIDGGYHVIVDDQETVRKAADDQIVDAEGGDNTHSLSICMIGRASQDWTTPYSSGEIGRAAVQAAAWCKAYNIPVVRVAPGAPGEAPTQRGIAEHADDHSPLSHGHTDPGLAFPIDGFLKIVNALVNPPINWAELKVIAEWKALVSEHPLTAGISSWEVTMLKQLLAQKGHDVGNDTVFYGDKLVAAVAAFKEEHNLPNRDGHVFGAEAATALIG